MADTVASEIITLPDPSAVAALPSSQRPLLPLRVEEVVSALKPPGLAAPPGLDEPVPALTPAKIDQKFHVHVSGLPAHFRSVGMLEVILEQARVCPLEIQLPDNNKDLAVVMFDSQEDAHKCKEHFLRAHWGSANVHTRILGFGFEGSSAEKENYIQPQTKMRNWKNELDAIDRAAGRFPWAHFRWNTMDVEPQAEWASNQRVQKAKTGTGTITAAAPLMVELSGLPLHFRSGPVLETVLEQAGLDGAIETIQMQPATDGSNIQLALLTFKTHEAAVQAMRHFKRCRWGGAQVSANLKDVQETSPRCDRTCSETSTDLASGSEEESDTASTV